MRMSDENVETLHLTNLQRQHIGEYSCSATNQIGENHSSTLNLRVQCKCFLCCHRNALYYAYTINIIDLYGTQEHTIAIYHKNIYIYFRVSSRLSLHLGAMVWCTMVAARIVALVQINFNQKLWAKSGLHRRWFNAMLHACNGSSIYWLVTCTLRFGLTISLNIV